MDYKTPLIFFSPIAAALLYTLIKNISGWGGKFQRYFTKQSQSVWGKESAFTRRWNSRFGYILSCAMIGFFGLMAILLIYSWAFVPFFNPKSSSQSSVSERDRQLLLTAIQDPFVLHIRKVIDGCNSGVNNGYSGFDFKPFTHYLKSKFVLMEIDNHAAMGGKTMTIIFTDKPDKLFYVWVYYKESSGQYDMRAFEPVSDVSADQAQQLYMNAKPLVDELGLAI